MEDRIGGKVQIDSYSAYELELDDWNLDKVLDDIIMVQYVDVSEDGKEIIRNGIHVPINVVTYVWRVGKVILAGTACKTVKEGDYVVFPNDKGIKAANINGLKNICFLNEPRVFGVCTPKFVEKTKPTIKSIVKK